MKRSRKVGEDKYARVLEVIRKAGPQGILQRDIGKALNISSREVSQIVSVLEKDGLIMRKPVSQGKSRTFRLIATSSNLKIGLDALEDCPCFSCTNLLSCGSGQPINPENCEDLTNWLLKP